MNMMLCVYCVFAICLILVTLTAGHYLAAKRLDGTAVVAILCTASCLFLLFNVVKFAEKTQEEITNIRIELSALHGDDKITTGTTDDLVVGVPTVDDHIRQADLITVE